MIEHRTAPFPKKNATRVVHGIYWNIYDHNGLSKVTFC